MRDGHLNKCRACVVAVVAKWRTENPDCRKREHVRVREKEGFSTREQYLKEHTENAIGRKASASKYAHKRRLQLRDRTVNMTELDELVLEEAFILAAQREESTGIKWSVDHIVPLNHKHASGLHNAWNVQVVPALWNSIKRNTNMTQYITGY